MFFAITTRPQCPETDLLLFLDPHLHDPHRPPPSSKDSRPNNHLGTFPLSVPVERGMGGAKITAAVVSGLLKGGGERGVGVQWSVQRVCVME